MNVIHFLMIIFVVNVVNATVKNTCDNVKTPLNVMRKKRHLTFAEGTNMVMTISLVKAIMVHAPSGWNIAIEIDVLFPILSPQMTNALHRKKFHHRQKRQFWQKIQNALDGYNLNGRSCIYQSICEARTHLAPPGKSLVHDILRALFSAPIHEKGFTEEVNETYYELLEPNVCERIHDCPISLLQFVLGLNKIF